MELDDIDLLYADFGVDVTHTPAGGGPTTAKAMFDRPGTVLVGGEMLATDYSVRFPVAAFQTVKRGDRFVIGGTTYLARENSQPADIDGLESIVPLGLVIT